VVAAYLPPGWPAGVHPPDSEEFEQTAVTWLLDVVPPDYRLHGVLRRHPYALAVLARHHVAACVRGAREGYRSARTELGGKLPPGGVESVLEVYRAEGSRLVETARAVDLVGRALRGEVFTPQLAGTQDERRGAGARDTWDNRGVRARDTRDNRGAGARYARDNRGAGARDDKDERDSKGKRDSTDERAGKAERDGKDERDATDDRDATAERAEKSEPGGKDERDASDDRDGRAERGAGRRDAKGRRGAKPARPR
jgi:hypothetical protein